MKKPNFIKKYLVIFLRDLVKPYTYKNYIEIKKSKNFVLIKVGFNMI